MMQSEQDPEALLGAVERKDFLRFINVGICLFVLIILTILALIIYTNVKR